MTDATAIPEPYQWDESFDVKVGSINDQHKKLFELIDALSKDQSNGDILNELLDTVKKHFQWEEELFSKHGYAQASAHKATHDKFLADCGAVTEVDDDVIKFLKRWLVTHVKGSDMKYVAPLTSAGAE